MVVVFEDVDQGLVAREATFRERVMTTMRVDTLDDRLAQGTSPESSAQLALRAQALVRPCRRHSVARRLQQLVEQADDPAAGARSVIVPVLYQRVARSREEFQALIDRLIEPGPVSARGIAMIQNLLKDGTGPLFHAGNRDDLGTLVLAALAALDSLEV